MASFIGELKQNQQQAQDAEAYRALVRSAEDSSLARNAAMQTKSAYDNADMGYGLTRAEIAGITGRPTSEVSYDTISDQQLQQLGYAKLAASQKVAEQPTKERIALSPEAVANQANMQQAAVDVNSGRLGLAGQMAGRPVDSARVQGYVDRLSMPGSFEMNADAQPQRYANVGEITDRLPNGDAEIKMMKQKGAY